jgi:hypothetical protein
MAEQQPEKGSKDTSRAPWQIFLSEVLQDETVLEALAEELGFNPVSLSRWGRGVVPRNAVRTLRNLVDASSFPKQYRDQFIEEVRKSYPDFYSEPNPLMEDIPVKEIPSLLYNQIIRSHAFVAEELVYWTLTNTICHQMFGHLDANESAGISAMLLLCTPPSLETGVVRSFYAPVRQIGERPSPLPIHFPFFVGTESLLTDVTPRYNRPLVLDEWEVAALSTPFPSEIKSLAIIPVQRRSKFAGCFLVSSRENEYFTKPHRQVVYEYGILMELAFRDQDFYSSSSLKLATLPPLDTQREQEARYPFRRRVERLRKQLGSEPGMASPNQEQLETLALQELEQQLIDV